MLRKIVAVAGLALCLSVEAAEPVAEPIVKPGDTVLFDGKLKVHVEDDGTTTRFDVAYTGTDGGSHGIGKTVESAKAAGWFVFPESANRVWLYRGGNLLTLIEMTDNPLGGALGTRASTISLTPGEAKTTAALTGAPKAVRERLPASFRAKGKGK